VAFTAGMEEKLDDIATDERPWIPVIQEFYTPFALTLERAQTEIEHVNKAAEVTDEVCEKCGKPMAIKLGRFGRFLSCTGFPDCKNARPLGGDETPPEATDEVCENCGKPMLVKTGRFGKFLSCSDYPECKTSRPIQVKLGLACPKCGEGELVEKKGRTGRAFYGCNRYPACDWISWARPLPDPCEVCGKMRVPLGQDKIHCLGCDGDLPTRPRKTDETGAASGGRRPAARGRAPAGRAASGGRANGTAAAATRRTASKATAKTTKAKASTAKASKNGTAPKAGAARKSAAGTGSTSAAARARRAG